MPLTGHISRKPQDVLTRDEVERIYRGSLEVLSETGMTVAHHQSLLILEEAGCEVDHEIQRVKFPARLVQWAIEQCPKTFEQRSRNPELTLSWGGGRVYFGSFPGFTWLDLDTQERREATVEDMARLTRLCDALPEVHTICSPVAHLADKPPEIEMEWVMATMLRNTEKTTMGASFSGSSKWVVEMCGVLGQQAQGSICMSSPLVIPGDQAQGVHDYGCAGHPLHMLSGPMRGATGPATMAGTMVLQTAEILGATVLGQLVNTGVGVVYVGYATPMDMRYGTMASGSIDVGIMAAGTAQMARYLGLPSAVFSPMTDAKVPDPQAAYEKHLQTLLCAQAGINHLMPIGGLENEGAHSPAQVVIDNEICAMVGNVLEGIRVDEESLAVELIKDVGPAPGSYLRAKHTRQHWRDEYRIPEVSVREGYDAWVAGGSRGIVENAAEIARELMETHVPEPLPPEVDRELDRILKAVEKEKLGS